MTTSMQPCPDDGFVVVGADSPVLPAGWEMQLVVGQDERVVIIPRSVVESAVMSVFPDLSDAIKTLVRGLSKSDSDVGFKYTWEIDKTKVEPKEMQQAIKYLRRFLRLQT